MIPVTLSGESVYLLHYRADWSAGFELRAHQLTQIDRSLGGISARIPSGDTLRSRLLFDLVLAWREAAEFRVALQRLKGQRVLCPFWPAAHDLLTGAAVYLAPGGEIYTTDDGTLYTGPGGDLPWVMSGIWLTFEQDWSSWEVHTTETPGGFTPSARAVRVPLLLGYFEQPPAPPAITDQLITCQIHFIESSAAAYALRTLPVPPVYGPSLNSQPVPLFPLAPDWSLLPQAGQATVEVERAIVGRGRELSQTYYPQESVRVLSLSYTPSTWTESAALLSFFSARLGQVQSFWLPGPLSECRLTAVTSATDSVVHVDEAALLGDNRYLAITCPGHTPVMRRIVSVDTIANTLTLNSPPGVFTPGQVNLVSLILVRFAKPELGIRFGGGRMDAARIDFVEEPMEYFNPAGETLRVTMGALPVEAYFYRFIRRYPATTAINRYTSFERDLMAGGELYLSRPIEHSAILDSLDPEALQVELTTRIFPGNPLAEFFPNTLEVALELEILRGLPDVNGLVGPTTLVFSGIVTQPSNQGPILRARGGHRLNILQRKVPVPVIQPECNETFGSVACGVDLNNWTYSATVVSVTASGLVLDNFSRTNGGAVDAFNTGWFAFGRLWYGTGEVYAARTIYNSSAISLGQVTVALSHTFLNPPANGSTVYLRPGCPGTIPWCQHYGNYPQGFRGFPTVPTGNPAFVTTRTTPGNATKK